MNKKKTRAFGKDVYLLGKDRSGQYRWLESASWDCGWYWGFGYIESYTNNKYPERAKDIREHTHFDSLFLNGRKNGYDAFKEMFEETPLSDNEVWKLVELMKSFYIAREYSNMLCRGGAHYTTNPAKDVIKCDAEYERINNIVIPAIVSEVYKILEGENDETV